MVALEDCIIIVRIVPMSTNINTEPNPKFVHCCKKANISGFDLRSGTESFRKVSPRKRSAKPIMSSPRDFFFLDLNIIKTNPNPTKGIENIEMSNLNPSKEIIHAVTVVPMFAPIITPTDCVRVSRPAFTKLTTITVVALDD